MFASAIAGVGTAVLVMYAVAFFAQLPKILKNGTEADIAFLFSQVFPESCHQKLQIQKAIEHI